MFHFCKIYQPDVAHWSLYHHLENHPGTWEWWQKSGPNFLCLPPHNQETRFKPHLVSFKSFHLYRQEFSLVFYLHHRDIMMLFSSATEKVQDPGSRVARRCLPGTFFSEDDGIFPQKQQKMTENSAKMIDIGKNFRVFPGTSTQRLPAI